MANVPIAMLQIQVGQVIISVNTTIADYKILIAGIFVCVRCAAIHRKIGTHVSKIKSLRLDKWSPEQINVSPEGSPSLTVDNAFHRQHDFQPKIQPKK